MAEQFVIITVSPVDGGSETLYTMIGTHYGRLLLVFRPNGEFESFAQYARQTLKPEFKIETVLVIANDVNHLYDELERRKLLPFGPSRVAVEGTDFFDEVMAQLITDTLWAEPVPPSPS